MSTSVNEIHATLPALALILSRICNKSTLSPGISLRVSLTRMTFALLKADESKGCGCRSGTVLEVDNKAILRSLASRTQFAAPNA